MKVGIIYLGSSEGMSEYTFEIAQAINKHCPVVVYLSTRNALREKWSGLDCEQHFFETYDGFKALILSLIFKAKIKRVAHTIDQGQVDIIFDTMPSPWQMHIKKRLSKDIPWSVIVHDPDPHPDRWRLLVHLNRLLNPLKCEVLIGISQYCYQLIKAKNPQHTCLLSKHGAYKPVATELRSAITTSRAKNKHKFVFFGRIEAYKGVDVLIKAFELAKQQNPQIELTVIGRGPLSPESKASLLNNGGRLFNEWVSDEFAMQEIDAHGVIVLPYLSATQSGPASIALARGVPCIATDQGALPEQIQHDNNGLIVKAACADSLSQAMLKLANEPELVEKMSKEAFRLSDNEFSWDNIAEKLVDDFSAVLAEK